MTIGVLFDKDGTLLDFHATWAGVVDDVLARLSRDPGLRLAMARAIGFDAEARRFVAGSAVVAGSSADIAGVLATMLPNRSPGEIEDIMNDAAVAAGDSGSLVPAVPDLPGFLDGLRARGWKTGIATHDGEAAARSQMRALRALDRFDFIAGYDSGHGLKPGPGMLLAFAEAVELAPSRIVMVGDSVHDLGVGPAAGAALTVGVLTGPATRADLADHADHVLDSIAELPALIEATL